MTRILPKQGQKIIYEGEVVDVFKVFSLKYYVIGKQYKGGAGWSKTLTSLPQNTVVIPKSATKFQIKALQGIIK